MEVNGRHDQGRARDCSTEAVGAERQISNLILTSLPMGEYESLLPHLEFIFMDWHHTLHEPSVAIEFGYFPNGGIVSIVVPVRDGRSADVGMVGREDFVGAPLAGGIDRSTQLALVQVASTAARLPASVLSGLLPSSPRLAMLLTRHALVQGMQFAQTAACNRLHDLHQRLARWLLMSQDRLDCNVLPYTQELLGTMLGTDRPSVTVALGKLQRNGSIRQGHGEIHIIDRNRPKMSSCECYAVIREFSGELDPNHR